MNERRTKLEAIFHAAMELASVEEREHYLAEACANDSELRREVDELLRSASAAEPVFQAGRLDWPLQVVGEDWRGRHGRGVHG